MSVRLIEDDQKVGFFVEIRMLVGLFERSSVRETSVTKEAGEGTCLGRVEVSGRLCCRGRTHRSGGVRGLPRGVANRGTSRPTTEQVT